MMTLQVLDPSSVIERRRVKPGLVGFVPVLERHQIWPNPPPSITEVGYKSCEVVTVLGGHLSEKDKEVGKKVQVEALIPKNL